MGSFCNLYNDKKNIKNTLIVYVDLIKFCEISLILHFFKEILFSDEVHIRMLFVALGRKLESHLTPCERYPCKDGGDKQVLFKLQTKG